MKRMQKGFGLIEMMIAMVIGLVLILGISAILISMTRTSDLRRKMAEVQGGQRLAMSMIGNSLRYAGAFPYVAGNNAATTFPAVAGKFGVGQSIVGTGANADADTVRLRFVASASSTASQGCSANLTAGSTYTDVFTIEGGYLVCEETNNTTGTTAPKVQLIAGLKGMNILYGVDSSGGGFVNQYLMASEVPANTWDNVKTVQVTLKFDNPLAKEKGQPATVQVTQTFPHAIGL
jgi:type IV pilus assembly protein PilW